MPARDALLIHAARMRIREDRLTELLRVALLSSRAFAHQLLSHEDVRPPAEGPVEVATQVWTGSGRRIDMQVLSYDLAGEHVIGRLWSEHKTGSGYSEGQLPDYARDLTNFPDPKQLITIADRLEDAPKDPLRRWCRLTWRQVAGLADATGRAERANWRENACDENAPARLRLLHELLTYLEEEHNVVLDPLSHLDIIAFSRANRASDVLTELLTRAGELSRLNQDGEATYSNDDWEVYWQLFDRSGSWAERLDGTVELDVWAHDEWVGTRMGQPALAVGFALPPHYYEHLRHSDNRAWRESAEQEGFSVGVAGGLTRVYRTKYLVELLAEGPLLDAQAIAIARWVDSSTETLSALDPGIAAIPAPARRRTRATAVSDGVTEVAEEGGLNEDADSPPDNQRRHDG